MMKKKIVVLTGAGISAESGISTFRDAGGLWEGHDIIEVASPQGWQKNPHLVLEFYNLRRKQLHQVKPNAAHIALAELEKDFDVYIVTQNVDNLHERAGSTNVLHLHGELFKVRSTGNPNLIYEWKEDLKWGDVCEEGYQLRPHVVWFGEEVPLMPQAINLAKMADVFMVIGTSLVVYPAAGLINYVADSIPKFLIDPNVTNITGVKNLITFPFSATKGVPMAIQKIREMYG